jgi:membrane associated rhomboid family serine protease
MFSFLNNIPQVTKNILILNILFFVLKYFFQSKGIDLDSLLGAHYINSPLFQPYQVVTHFFMHADFFHIFFNMWLFVMLGGFLERLWGPKRFFIFYIASALGAFALYNIIGFYQINELKSQLTSVVDMEYINHILRSSSTNTVINDLNEYVRTLQIEPSLFQQLENYISLSLTPMIGASGAVFGVMAAFAILFPNTEFMLYFAIPVKAKYLVGAYFVFELYQSFNAPGDNVAHLAHVGGAIVGAILILIWRKNDKKNFY